LEQSYSISRRVRRDRPVNPLLQRLGLGPGERAVLVHADDVGLCQATIPAFAGLIEQGLVSTGSVMVPAPWFPEAAAFCRSHPEADLGVHLTLTSEWTGYRWGPVSTRDPATGLLDAAGYFHARPAAVAAEADPEAVRREIEAQVQLARRAGIEPTHADLHMLTLLEPQLLPLYCEAAQRWDLPVPTFRPRAETATIPLGGHPDEIAGLLHGTAGPWPAVCDSWVTLGLRRSEDRIGQAKRLFDALPPGLTHLSIHPALDTPELRAISPDWRCRVADYEAFRSAELREHVRRAGIRVIGYREVLAAGADRAFWR
jgi:predicted glycoside hydrolase/deacetylase ChbG (UPF0249 family)